MPWRSPLHECRGRDCPVVFKPAHPVPCVARRPFWSRRFGGHAAAKKAGFAQDDVIVAIDGLTSRLSESELIGNLLQRRRVGKSVEGTVLRGTQRVALILPRQ